MKECKHAKEDFLYMTAFCKNCSNDFKITKDLIFSAGDLSAYATLCPNCNFLKKLPFKDVVKTFGNIKVL